MRHEIDRTMLLSCGTHVPIGVFVELNVPVTKCVKPSSQLAQLLRREHPGGSHGFTQHLHPVGQFKSHVPEYALHASQGVLNVDDSISGRGARTNSINETAL